MNRHVKRGLFTCLVLSFLSPSAFAQNHNYASDAALFGSSDPFQNVGLSAGFNVTIPLGAKSTKYNADNARFGLKLSLTQSEAYSATHPNFKLSGDLLELGFNFDGTPNLQMYGNDIYAPLFGPLYADETETDEGETPNKTKGPGSGAVLIGILGVGTLGTLVLVNEAADDFSDCFRDIFRNDDPKCN